MKLVSVNLGVERAVDTKTGRTGYFKAPQTGPVEVTPMGLAGDVIIDRENHGGAEQAVYLFPLADLTWWSDRMGRSFGPGSFGENLTYDGPETSAIAIGDRIGIGEVMLEVTSPRTPCATFTAVMGDSTAAKAMYASGRCGFYCRVLRTGMVAADTTISFKPFDGQRISVTAMYQLQSGNLPPGIRREALLATPLHSEAREMLENTPPKET